MNLLTFLEKGEIHPAPQKKVIPAQEFAQLLALPEILQKLKEEESRYRQEVTKEGETLKEQAEITGFNEGLLQWSEQIAFLEGEIKKVRKEMENAVVPLALAAVRKMIGRELETKPETVTDIVSTALKTVLHHKRVILYVNPQDMEDLEADKNRIKGLFERLESLAITPRGDIERGGCVIETEAGIINARLEDQLNALESAFRSFFKTNFSGSTP